MIKREGSAVLAPDGSDKKSNSHRVALTIAVAAVLTVVVVGAIAAAGAIRRPKRASAVPGTTAQQPQTGTYGPGTFTVPQVPPRELNIMAQSAYFGYWRNDATVGSVLVLNNATNIELTVRPTLYNSAGQALSVSPVTLAARQHVSINIADWIGASAAGTGFQEGSLILNYQSQSPADVGALLHRYGFRASPELRRFRTRDAYEHIVQAQGSVVAAYGVSSTAWPFQTCFGSSAPVTLTANAVRREGSINR
jgi:hypothetical protein